MPRQPATTAQAAAALIKAPIDDAPVFHGASTALLVAIATGRVDVGALVREEPASRGVGKSGQWVGFPVAEKLWATR